MVISRILWGLRLLMTYLHAVVILTVTSFPQLHTFASSLDGPTGGRRGGRGEPKLGIKAVRTWACVRTELRAATVPPARSSRRGKVSFQWLNTGRGWCAASPWPAWSARSPSPACASPRWWTEGVPGAASGAPPCLQTRSSAPTSAGKLVIYLFIYLFIYLKKKENEKSFVWEFDLVFAWYVSAKNIHLKPWVWQEYGTSPETCYFKVHSCVTEVLQVCSIIHRMTLVIIL